MVTTTAGPSQKFPNSGNNVCIPAWTRTPSHVQGHCYGKHSHTGAELPLFFGVLSVSALSHTHAQSRSPQNRTGREPTPDERFQQSQWERTGAAPSPGFLRRSDKKPPKGPRRSMRPRSRPVSRSESRAHLCGDLLVVKALSLTHRWRT